MAKERKNYLILSIIGLIGLILILEFFPDFFKYLLMNTSNLSTASKSHESGKKVSILGEWLRAQEGTPPPKKISRNNSSLLILVWRYGVFLEKRHIRRFTDNISFSPWQDCSVKNCQLSYRDEDLKRADAVVFHLHMTKGVEELPFERGKTNQIWIFMTDESPLHTFLYEAGNRHISDYNNIFDWSMTYRTNSDIPVAYGRTIKRKKIVPSALNEIGFASKTKLVAIMGSNCSTKNRRYMYIRNLKKILENDLDIYGRCFDGNITACPGHFHRDCPLLYNYKFYLAFENSECREYLTEKIYWNAYEKKSVPIVMGAPRRDCELLLPPHSFIHVDDFSSPNDLVRYLRYLDDNDNAYKKYHEWRISYLVLNEHGYFGSASKHYCRICEALNYNERPTLKYRSIGDYWNAKRDCNSYF